MINKVLIAEDHETTNLSVQRVLEEIGVEQPEYVYYCDDALAKISRAKQAGNPFDLLITDLYFEKDHNVQQLTEGTQLVEKARSVQPELKVLVFSAENRPAVIEQLYEKYEIDAFVRKARNDAKELRIAIDSMAKNQRYYPRHLRQFVGNNSYEFNAFDIAILRLLADGIKQKDIPFYLRRDNIKPSGLSSVEKRLSFLKDELSCSSNEQLIAFCKDKGIL
jgi:two-component system capsular synthesis response regulator RcsB